MNDISRRVFLGGASVAGVAPIATLGAPPVAVPLAEPRQFTVKVGPNGPNVLVDHENSGQMPVLATQANPRQKNLLCTPVNNMVQFEVPFGCRGDNHKPVCRHRIQTPTTFATGEFVFESRERVEIQVYGKPTKTILTKVSLKLNPIEGQKGECSPPMPVECCILCDGFLYCSESPFCVVCDDEVLLCCEVEP